MLGTIFQTDGRSLKQRKCRESRFHEDSQNIRGGRNDIYRLIFQNNDMQISLRGVCSSSAFRESFRCPSKAVCLYGLNRKMCTLQVLLQNLFFELGNKFAGTVFKLEKGGKPVSSSKVESFIDIFPKVESRVISLRKSDHNLAFLLRYLGDIEACLN